MDEITTHASAPTVWIEALADSKAQIDAGRTVPLEPVLARLRASVDRMEAARATQAKRLAGDV